MSLKLFKKVSYKISSLITKNYSTSFSLATSLLDKQNRDGIYAIYGFVRLADEIVDTFNNYDKIYLLNRLEEDLYYALSNEISNNPVVYAFQDTVKKYNIEREYINAFLESMKLDINTKIYDEELIKKYIYGSADVVGLMCLKIFCKGDELLFNKLKVYAQKLGTAFQKINFLRDLNNDKNNLQRIYFPELINNELNENIKNKIVADIEKEIELAYDGIKQLPGRSKLAVFIAYTYYKKLLLKIKKSNVESLINNRLRISNFKKILLIIKAIIYYKFKII